VNTNWLQVPCKCADEDCECTPKSADPACMNQAADAVKEMVKDFHLLFPSQIDQSQCATRAADYASLGSDNTYVKYCGSGSKCKGHMCRREVTETERTAILNKHNELRALVASGNAKAQNNVTMEAAADMNELVWDDEIALGAQM